MVSTQKVVAMVDYQDVIDKIDLQNFLIPTTLSMKKGKLQVAIKVPCKLTGTPMSIEFDRGVLNTEDEQEALRYIYWNVQEAILHEVGECFKVEGKLVFDPHETDKGKQVLLIGMPPEENWEDRIVVINDN